MSNKMLKFQLSICNFQRRKSYVTITVLILMMVLVAASYSYADALFSELTIARNNKGASVAFSLADAGIQEAIYRVQYDTATRDTFMNSTNGTTIFSHNQPALIPNGSYQVTIQNTAKGAATVTAIGNYQIGTLRTARREIEVGIAQAPSTPSYPYDGGIFGSGGAGSSIADIDFWYAPVRVYNGSILSNRDINFKFGSDVDIEGTFNIIDEQPVPSGKAIEAGDNVTISWPSHVDCNCLINDDGNPATPQCGDNPGCTAIEGATAKTMPPIDFDSSSPNSYKNRAKNTTGPSPDGNQYFIKQQDFKALIPKFSSATFNGVVYIDGPLDIDWGRTITMNGVIAASGGITISFGQLFLNPPTGGGASGVLTQASFNIGTLGNFSGTGLVYTGDRTQINASFPYPISLTGGILSRRTWVSGFRTVNIHFDADVINTALGNPNETPVIEINHWEEEY